MLFAARVFLLIVLAEAVRPGSIAAVSAQPAGTVPDESSVEAASDAMSRVPVQTIREEVAAGRYVPLTADALRDLLMRQSTESVTDKIPSLRRADYFAELQGTGLINGTLELQIETAAGDRCVVLGHCGLQDLQFHVDGRPVPSASLADGRLALIVSEPTDTVGGTWSFEGRPTEGGAEFDIRLPEAAVTHLQLKTPKDVTLSCRNSDAVVTQSERAEGILWDVYGNGGAMMLECVRKTGTSRHPTAERAWRVDAEFRVFPKSVDSHWEIRLPPAEPGDVVSIPMPDTGTIVHVAGEFGPLTVERDTDERRLIVRRDGQTGNRISIHMADNGPKTDPVALPLPPVGIRLIRQGRPMDLPVQAAALRLVVARDLAVRSLHLDGIYQKDVRYASSTGDQVIELVRFAAAARARVQVVKAQAMVRQRLLVHRADATSPDLTVYVELEPDSGRLYDVSWVLSEAWQPTEVTDMRSLQPVYFITRRGLTSGSQTLHVALRTFSTRNQPSRLRIRFRSTRRIPGDTLSAPVMSNPRYRADGMYVLASPAVRIPQSLNPQRIEDIIAVMVRQFPWIDAAELRTDGLWLTRVGTLQPESRSSTAERPVLSQVDVVYQVRASSDRLSESIRITLESADSLPRTVSVSFPDGVDVRLSSAAPGARLVRIGRDPVQGVQDWLLSLPSAVQEQRTAVFELSVNRDILPQMPAAVPVFSGVGSVRIVAGSGGSGQDANPGFELVAIDEESGGESVLLNPGTTVPLPHPAGPYHVRVASSGPSRSRLAVRGTILCLPDAGRAAGRCDCFADLIVSRSGSADFLSVHWAPRESVRAKADTGPQHPDSHVSAASVFIDGHPVWAPRTDGRMQIPLPSDRTVCRVQIVWSAKIALNGWLRREVQIPVPLIEADGSHRLDRWILLPDADLLPAGPADSSRSIAAAARVLSGSHADSETSGPLPGPVRHFLLRWRLAEEALPRVVRSESGPYVLSARFLSQRILKGFALTACLATVVLLTSLRSRTDLLWVLLLTAALLLSLLSAAEAAWASAGMCTGILITALGRPTGRWFLHVFRQRSVKRSAGSESAAAVVLAVLSVLTTGQAPFPSSAPPFLVADDGREETTTIYVRQDILAELQRPEQPDAAVVVTDSAAAVHVRPQAAVQTDITVTLLHDRLAETGSFVLPLDASTLRLCRINGQAVAPTRNHRGQAVIDVRRFAVPSETEGENGSENESPSEWQSLELQYTLLTETESGPDRVAMRLPMPWSPRARITVHSGGDSADQVTVESSGQEFSAESEDGRLWTFPELYGAGPVRLVLRKTVRPAPDVQVPVTAAANITCLAELTDSATRLTCDYGLTPLNPAEEPFREIQIPAVPGFQAVSCRTKDGQSLPFHSGGEWLIIQNSRPLDGFRMIWTSEVSGIHPQRVLPAAAWQPPRGCRAESRLLAVRTPDPFAVRVLGPPEQRPESIVPGEQDLKLSGLTAADQFFDLQNVHSDVRLELLLRPLQRTVSLTQTVLVGVDSLDVTCQCDLEIAGLQLFRQAFRIPPELKIDEIEVLSGSTNRLRSWSVGAGNLLLTLEEGVTGSLQIRIHGVLPVDAGTAVYRVIEAEGVRAAGSELLLSAAGTASALLLDPGDADIEDLLPAAGLPLTSVPVAIDVRSVTEPLIIRTRPLRGVRADAVVLQRSHASGPVFDVAVRVQAGDQVWRPELTLPEGFHCERMEWIADAQVQELPVTGSHPLPDPLQPGQEALLLLTGMRPQPAGDEWNLPLPSLSPELTIDTVRGYRASRSDERTGNWLREEAFLDSHRLPVGFLDLRGDVRLNGDAGTVIVTRQQEPEPSGTAAVRNVRRIVTVTRLWGSGSLLRGTTAVLIDFGAALEARMRIPGEWHVTVCRVDGRSIPWTVPGESLVVTRERDIQWLIIEWSRETFRPGLLFQPRPFRIPQVRTDQESHFVVLDAPREEQWLPGEGLSVVTGSTLSAAMNGLLPSPGTEPGRPAAAGEPEAAGGALADGPASGIGTELLVSRLLRDTSTVCQITETAPALVQCRRRLQWPQWLSLLTAAVVGTAAAGRRFLRRPPAGKAAHTISTILMPGETNEGGDSSGQGLPQNRDQSDG